MNLGSHSHSNDHTSLFRLPQKIPGTVQTVHFALPVLHGNYIQCLCCACLKGKVVISCGIKRGVKRSLKPQVWWEVQHREQTQPGTVKALYSCAMVKPYPRLVELCYIPTIIEVRWQPHHRGFVWVSIRCVEPLCYGSGGISVWFSLHFPSHPSCWAPSMTLLDDVRLWDGFLTGQLWSLPDSLSTGALSIKLHEWSSGHPEILLLTLESFHCSFWDED